MFWKQFKVFLGLKKKELLWWWECNGKEMVAIVLIFVTLCGGATGYIWLARTYFPVLKIIGKVSVAILGILGVGFIIFMLGYALFDFIRSNWREAGRLIKEGKA